MVEPYTPTTDEVRRFFTNGKSEEMCASSWHEAYAREFDIWLTEHSRQVRAEALQEAAREVHIEARWARECLGSGRPYRTLERLLEFEQILTDRIAAGEDA